MFYYLSLIATLAIMPTLFSAQEFIANHTWKSPETLIITIPFELKKPDALLKNSLHFSVDTPALEITAWNSTEPARMVYDASHTIESLAYTGTGSLEVTLQVTQPTSLPETAQLFMHYQRKTDDTPQEFRYEFSTQAMPANKVSAETKPEELTLSA